MIETFLESNDIPENGKHMMKEYKGQKKVSFPSSTHKSVSSKKVKAKGSSALELTFFSYLRGIKSRSFANRNL